MFKFLNYEKNMFSFLSSFNLKSLKKIIESLKVSNQLYIIFSK